MMEITEILVEKKEIRKKAEKVIKNFCWRKLTNFPEKVKWWSASLKRLEIAALQ